MASSRPVLLYSILLALIAITGISFLESCANIIPPLGGPRDSLPPVLVNATPKESVMDFKGKKIVFTFDEYVLVDQVQDNLVVSPTPKINPTVESRLKTVTVTIKDTLEPNTTYLLDFGNAIKDVNENNIFKHFQYVFSTGKYIDSLELSGKVIMAETGRSDSTLIVVLHKNLTDSAVSNERPRYYTKLDKEGNFHFTHLSPGTYALYTMKDEGGSKRYLSGAQVFGFAQNPVELNGPQQPVTLWAYAEPAEPKKPGSNKTPTPPKAKNEDEEKDKRLKYSNTLEGNRQDVLKPLVIKFSGPLKTFDSTKLHLLNAKFAPISNYTIERDTTNSIFTIRYNWPLNQDFILIAEKGMAEDSLGKSVLRDDTTRFKTMKDIDYGSMKFRFANLDTSRKPVLQLLQSEKVVFSYPVTSKELLIRRFRPAEFELRILYDDNGNGKWDYGSFYTNRRQPEKVQPVAKKLVVKANWDNEIDISL